jgi:NADPH:quinone reductase-like Zn-dependent oxidoreductase
LRDRGILVTTLTEPSAEEMRKHGVRATRYTVQADGDELAQISQMLDTGKVKPKVTKTFPLSAAAQALDSVEHGHSEGKIVLTVD